MKNNLFIVLLVMSRWQAEGYPQPSINPSSPEILIESTYFFPRNLSDSSTSLQATFFTPEKNDSTNSIFLYGNQVAWPQECRKCWWNVASQGQQCSNVCTAAFYPHGNFEQTGTFHGYNRVSSNYECPSWSPSPCSIAQSYAYTWTTTWSISLSYDFSKIVTGSIGWSFAYSASTTTTYTGYVGAGMTGYAAFAPWTRQTMGTLKVFLDNREIRSTWVDTIYPYLDHNRNEVGTYTILRA